MKTLSLIALSFTFLAGTTSFADTLAEIQAAVDTCNPCGSSDPCACCTTDEEKKACEKGNSESFETLPADGGWQVVPRN